MANTAIGLPISGSCLRGHRNISSLRDIVGELQRPYRGGFLGNPQPHLLDLDFDPSDQVRLNCSSRWWSWRRWYFCAVLIPLPAFEVQVQVQAHNSRHQVTKWCQYEVLHTRKCPEIQDQEIHWEEPIIPKLAIFYCNPRNLHGNRWWRSHSCD